MSLEIRQQNNPTTNGDDILGAVIVSDGCSNDLKDPSIPVDFMPEVFDTIDDAGKFAVNKAMKDTNFEYGGKIYRIGDKYRVTELYQGCKRAINGFEKIQPKEKIGILVGTYHSHGKAESVSQLSFSAEDMNAQEVLRVPGYLGIDAKEFARYKIPIGVQKYCPGLPPPRRRTY